MKEIKFSHKYPKLWGQQKAELIAVRIINAQAVAINKDLLEYDTKYSVYKKSEDLIHYISFQQFEYYKLPEEGHLIQLIFVGDKDIPFCTLREYTDKKYDYYKNSIGDIFKIVIISDIKSTHI
jgi:hypothetical protein